MGFQNIILEGDALHIVQLLNQNTTILSDVGNLVNEGRIRMRQFKEIKVQHVRMEANFAADGVANHVLATMENCYWVEEWPDFLNDVIAIDCKPV
ncbi:hypothetical protein REPUB_Repub14bG0033400 [Reevesia pubescens]